MRALVASVGTAIAILAASSATAQEPSTAQPKPAGEAAPVPARRLRLDLDRHVDAVVKRRSESDLPRFEDRIEVTEQAQAALEALLRGVELACSPSSDGPPPTSELNDFKPVPIPPYADFVAAARAIAKALKKWNPWKGEPRYVLYAVRRGDTLRLLLREGELPLSQRLAVPGTAWDEIARFHDRGEATTALRRLERGFETLARQTPGEPPHPSMRISCLPSSSR